MIHPFPAGFRVEEIDTDGATIHTRIGGPGAGGRDAARLRRHRRHVGAGRDRDRGSHTVVVPDLRGMGLSSQPAGGYDKKTQALDIAGVLDALKIDKVAWSATTSATWWPTPSPRSSPSGSRAGW